VEEDILGPTVQEDSLLRIWKNIINY
jgi:hypothetical protein